MRKALLLVMIALSEGCASVPDVEYEDLPHFAYVPIRESSIIDRRSEFADIFCSVFYSGIEPEFADRDCGEFLHLDAEPDGAMSQLELEGAEPLRFVFVPGFLGDCLQSFTTPFLDSRHLLEAEGHITELLMVGGRASSAHNAAIIAERLGSHELQREGPPIVLVGYSKGVPDILEAVATYPDAMSRVVAVVSVAGVVNGTPIASDQSNFMRFLIEHLPMSDCAGGPDDGSAIESLTYEYRQPWLQANFRDTHIKYFSVIAYGSSKEMSAVMKSTYRDLALLDPRNDGQLIYRDAIVPGSVLLAYVRSDHLAVALPIEEDDGFLRNRLVSKNAFPRGVLLKSILISVQRALD